MANSAKHKHSRQRSVLPWNKGRPISGDLLTAGYGSNYQSDLTMNHIYFTALVNGAGLAAALAKSEGRERVYVVEPTSEFENDPNVTNKKI